MKYTKEGLIPTNWYAITGAPSSGTTAVVNELSLGGYHTVAEVARAVIDHHLSTGSPLSELRGTRDLEREFQIATLRRNEAITHLVPPDRLVFWTRFPGFDSSAFYPNGSTEPTEEQLLDNMFGDQDIIFEHRYGLRGIFQMDRLPFKQDYARTEDASRAVKLDQLIELFCGLQKSPVIRVPVMPVEDRAKFILDRVPVSLKWFKR